ncbi:hypothetical protein GEOBRER4_n2802 [Citrifermentans bremense]|uniref:Tubulin/FtsZ 2-layer sandwich domain-containing protein n=1 Tax=Citrifermentans bremense TaxID=60035 RepID=A0A6S6M3H9_9BACT|nr:hypothetical protein [Citrifermentans bremense]BCG47949.1 hypothetical protein GEOBRER4_n2802 [Citrifermentans bremense]
MKRREFMQVLGTGLLSTVIMPGVMGRILIQPVGRVTVPFDFDSEECCKILVVGIGKAVAPSIAIISQGAPHTSCHQVIFDPSGKGTDLGDLLTQVRTSHLLFLLSAFDDPACRPIFEALGAAARESNLLTVGVSPYGAPLQDMKMLSSLWPVTRLALPPFPQLAENIAVDLSGWDWYATRHMVATIVEIILIPSLICIDFADVKSILTAGTLGCMGVGVAPVKMAQIAAMRAFDRLSAQGFKSSAESGFLACVRGSDMMTMDDFDDAARVIHETIPEDSNVICSIIMDESMGGNIKVTVLATTPVSAPQAHLF